MKQETYKQGQYSQFKLENGKRYFLETLPKELTIKKVMFFTIPSKTIWSYKLPFYIRTATESWQTSVELLDIVIKALGSIRNEDDLKGILDPIVESYVTSNKKKAEILALQKVGHHALEVK